MQEAVDAGLECLEKLAKAVKARLVIDAVS